MSKEREALKQLLEAIDKELPHNMKHIAAGQRFNARTMLAQPEQICGFDVVLDESMPPDTFKLAQPAQSGLNHLWLATHPDKLEQPEQEPTFTFGEVERTMQALRKGTLEQQQAYEVMKDKSLYTTPPQRTWVGLTDEQIDDLSRTMVKGNKSVNWLCRAHDAKLRELNEAPQPKEPEQEPVALETVYETIIQWDECGGKRSRRELARRIVALYTTPPQRTWVGLTDEEKAELDEKYGDDTLAHLDAVEAKLKEKNT